MIMRILILSIMSLCPPLFAGNSQSNELRDMTKPRTRVRAEAKITVQSSEAKPYDQSASLVSMQRFRGKLRGRQGTFVLQGQEIVENGKIKVTWFVVPGSGTAFAP